MEDEDFRRDLSRQRLANSKFRVCINELRALLKSVDKNTESIESMLETRMTELTNLKEETMLVSNKLHKHQNTNSEELEAAEEAQLKLEEALLAYHATKFAIEEMVSLENVDDKATESIVSDDLGAAEGSDKETSDEEEEEAENENGSISLTKSLLLCLFVIIVFYFGLGLVISTVMDSRVKSDTTGININIILYYHM